ncbi:Rho GTPase activation protein [Auricularia subglabra TFB-10046 SS5]|nr:Rho GTPase activation protein [Auricularia subglabra TFB-10046 SS5]
MGLNNSTMTPHGGGAVVAPFDGNRPFRIKIPSADSVAEGTSAALLRGTMHTSSGRTVDVALKVFRFPLNREQRELYRSLYRKELEVAERLGDSKQYILPYLGTSILAYQPALTGRHPWPGHDNGVVAMKILTSTRHPRPTGDCVWRGLTDGWWDLCVKCWEVEPTMRPGIQEVTEALQLSCALEGRNATILEARSFRVSLKKQMSGSDVVAPPVLIPLCAAIERHGMDSTRIYRLKGALQKTVKLKAQLDLGDAVELDSPEWAADVDVIGDVLLTWLRELPKPLIKIYRAADLAEASDIESDELRCQRASFIVPRFPKENSSTLKYLLGHLHRLSQNEAVNELSIEKLAIIFGPLLMDIPASHTVLDSGEFVALPTTSDVHRQIRGLETLLAFYTEIFEKNPPAPTVISWAGLEWKACSSAEGDYRRQRNIEVSSGSEEGSSDSESSSDSD